MGPAKSLNASVNIARKMESWKEHRWCKNIVYCTILSYTNTDLGPAENGMYAYEDLVLMFSGVKRKGSKTWKMYPFSQIALDIM